MHRMCNQRERLIGYIYGEGDAGDRAEVQRHVDGCAECRAEVAALRSVREDLLAWEVPAHESVWRPFVAAPVTPWWRQVPAWAMATAAGVMLMLGAAGGAVVQAYGPDRTVARQSNVLTAPATPVLTSADLTAAEQRILARMRQEVGAVGARVDQVSSRSQSVRLLEGDHSSLAGELEQLRAQNEAQLRVLKSIYDELGGMRTLAASRNASLEQRFKDLSSLVYTQLQLK
jgi:hypothetical protein